MGLGEPILRSMVWLVDLAQEESPIGKYWAMVKLNVKNALNSAKLDYEHPG